MPLAGAIGEWRPLNPRRNDRGWVRVTGTDPDRVLKLCQMLAGARPPSTMLQIAEAGPGLYVGHELSLVVTGPAIFDTLESLLEERYARTFIVYPFDAVHHPSRPGVAHRANWIGQHAIKLRGLIYRADAQVIVAGCTTNGGRVLDSLIVSKYHVASNGVIIASNRP